MDVKHLSDLISPEELFGYGRSDQLPEKELNLARDAVRCYYDVVLLMVGGDDFRFAAYMTALTGIERALQMKAKAMH